MSMIIVNRKNLVRVAGALGTGLRLSKEGVFNAVKEFKETSRLVGQAFRDALKGEVVDAEVVEDVGGR